MVNLHCNGSNSFLYVNAVKMYQFKAKGSEIKPYPLWLGNISKDFREHEEQENMTKEVYTIFVLIIMLLMLTIF